MFWKKPKPVEQANQEQEVSASQEPSAPNGYFSTDLPDPRKSRITIIAEAIKRSIQKTGADFKWINAKGQAVAMDDADDVALKSAYQVSQQNISDVQFAWFASQGFIGHQTAAIIAQHWLVDKACTMPARDAVRNGWEITANDGTEITPETFDAIRKADERYKLTDNLVEFVRMGRVFGVRVAMFIVESTDPLYYEKPFNPDGVTKGSYKGITQIDPYWVAPELSIQAASDPAAVDFYEPTWWRIRGKRVHRTHLCIFRNAEVPDILKPSYLYGGVPVPQRIFERVYAAERTANEAPQLAMTKRTNAIHTDIAAALANEGQFEQRMLQWAHYRDNYGIKVLGTDETMEQFDTTLSELDAVIMTQYQIVAAAANVPATKLLGTTPKGFQSTGEFELKSYHEELESIQTHDLTPMIERHHMLLIRSEIAPEAPFSTSVVWKPLDSPSSKELAEVNKIKADTDSVLLNAGAIDGEDIRNRIMNDPDSGYSGLSDEEELPSGEIDPNAIVENEQEHQEAAPEENIQKASMNGAQIASMVEVLNSVATGQIPRESGINILSLAFPISRQDAEGMMGEIGRGFVPAAPTPKEPGFGN